MKKFFLLSMFCCLLFTVKIFADITVDDKQLAEINKLSETAPSGLANQAPAAEPAPTSSSETAKSAETNQGDSVDITAAGQSQSGNSYMSIKPVAPAVEAQPQTQVENQSVEMPKAQEEVAAKPASVPSVTTKKTEAKADVAAATPATNQVDLPVVPVATIKDQVTPAEALPEPKKDLQDLSEPNPNDMENVKPDLKPYAVEVPVANYTSAERDKAFKVALEQLLLKLTGENDIQTLFTKAPNLEGQIKDPSVFVRSYNYAQHSMLDKVAPITAQAISAAVVQPVDNSTQTNYLQIQFDPAGIAQVLPKNLRQPETVKTTETEKIAKPKSESMQKASESIISHVTEELKSLGKIDNTLPKPEVLAQVPSKPVVDENKVAENKVTENRPGDVIALRVNNVKNLDQYSDVVKYLRTLPKVTRVDLQNLNPDNVELTVTCVGGKDALEKSLKDVKQAKLTAVVANTAADGASVVDLNFNWNG